MTEPRKPEQKPQVVTAVQKWYSKRQWRAAGAVVAAGLVFGLFMVMFKLPTATEQAGDFAELMQSAQESGAPPGSSQSLRVINRTGSRCRRKAVPKWTTKAVYLTRINNRMPNRQATLNRRARMRRIRRRRSQRQTTVQQTGSRARGEPG